METEAAQDDSSDCSVPGWRGQPPSQKNPTGFSFLFSKYHLAISWLSYFLGNNQKTKHFFNPNKL